MLSPSCLQGFLGCCLVVFHFSPRCGLKIVFQLSSTVSICLPEFVFQLSPSVFHLSPNVFSNCFRSASKMWSSSSLPIVSLGLEFETVNADGLQSWVNCVRLSGCLSLLVCVSLCLSLWLPGFPSCVSGSGYWLSPDASLHWSLFACLPVWLSTASGVRLSRCLSSLVSLHLFPALASGVSILGGVVSSRFHLSFLPFLCSFLPLCLLVVSGVTPA